jgi:2-methylcitrate dehydratase PrpD
MKFDGPHFTNALGIAGSTSAGLLEFSHSGNGAMVKRLHLGRAAEGGVLAASLAADGFTGPSTVIEGPAGFLKAFCNQTDLSQLTLGVGTQWRSSSIMLKRFACHITAHTAVEAILELRAANRISGSDVAEVRIEGSRRMATTNNIPNPADILIAQFSIPFCAALALYRNAVDPYSWDESALHDANITAMIPKVRMVAAAGQSDADVASTVTLTLKDGRTLSQRVTEFTGTPSRPLTGQPLREKFLLLTRKQAAKRMEEIYERVQNIEAESRLDWLHV